MSTSVKLYSIYYDEASRLKCPRGFEPLDNRMGNPAMYEILPIRKAIQEKGFGKHDWVGFFSPKFNEKTGLVAKDIHEELSKTPQSVSLVSFTAAWDQIAFWQNPWEQGDYNHPGLAKLAQEVATLGGYEIDLLHTIGDFQTAVYSHYLVAKPDFWAEWARLVDIYLDILKKRPELQQTTAAHRGGPVQIHAFLAERLPCLILLNGQHKASFCQKILRHPISFQSLYSAQKNANGRSIIDEVRRYLLYAEHCKRQYRQTKDPTHLDNYWRARMCIPHYGWTNFTRTAQAFLKGRAFEVSEQGLSFTDRNAG